MVDQGTDALAHLLQIGEEQPAFQAQQQQARPALICRMVAGDGAEHIGAALAGRQPVSPLAMLANPRANSSRSDVGRGSCGPWKARAAAMLSLKLIRAMPIAPGQSNGNNSLRDS